jgi:putative serine protease PepD
MTAGYDPFDPAAPDALAPQRDRSGQHDGSGGGRETGPETERLGPLPPPITSPAGPAHTGQVRSGSATVAMPQVHAGPYHPPGHYGPPRVHQTGAAQRRGGRLGAVAFVLAVLLLLLAGAQSYLLFGLNRQLDQANNKAAADRVNASAKADALEARIKELEKRAGNSLDAQAVAAEVTPSVFRVIAGEFSGTAFALGKEAEGGGTDLLTNFHVIEASYTSGSRSVALERTNARYPAKVVRVDENNDLALLHSDEKFPRLTADADGAKPGQPVIVIGAPLGLNETVTTGVVSAVRDMPAGRLLQFDAPINPGSSGGPVINAQRKVVGVATFKARGAEGIGLAIPIGVACQAFGVC